MLLVLLLVVAGFAGYLALERRPRQTPPPVHHLTTFQTEGAVAAPAARWPGRTIERVSAARIQAATRIATEIE